jgi:uncharacterized surface protein with fasciclin (FAS1) repeats
MVTTLNGDSVTVSIVGGAVFINNAQVIIADIIADNGVVHVIDAVLVPASTIFGCTSMTACNYNENATANDGSCVFPGASCDDNDTETINDVLGADCLCAGIIPNNTVVDIIINSADHDTLEAAVSAAGLVGVLSGTGPFTVFAPTDAAFAALPAGTIEALLAEPSGLLTQILTYHVVAGSALSIDLEDGMELTTLQGQSVTVTIVGSNVFINNAQVTVANIIADNGVVHVIDAVLTPTSFVNEARMNSVLVYPNPVAEQLTVSMPSMTGVTVYSIYSITGELVASGNINSTTTTLAVDALSQGMYQLKVVNGNDCVTRSFMKK